MDYRHELACGESMKRTEHGEQVALFGWSEANKYRTPELALLFAIPNAGAGAQRGQAGKMRAEGCKSGVPDLAMLVPRRGYHGLLIEMKTDKGRISETQQWWLDSLLKQGYCAKVCRCFEAARDLIIWYLSPEQGTESEL